MSSVFNLSTRYFKAEEGLKTPGAKEQNFFSFFE